MFTVSENNVRYFQALNQSHDASQPTSCCSGAETSSTAERLQENRSRQANQLFSVVLLQPLKHVRTADCIVSVKRQQEGAARTRTTSLEKLSSSCFLSQQKHFDVTYRLVTRFDIKRAVCYFSCPTEPFLWFFEWP